MTVSHDAIAALPATTPANKQLLRKVAQLEEDREVVLRQAVGFVEEEKAQRTEGPDGRTVAFP